MSSFDNTYDNYDNIKESQGDQSHHPEFLRNSRMKCVRGVKTATGRTVHLGRPSSDGSTSIYKLHYTDDSRYQTTNIKLCGICNSRFCNSLDFTPLPKNMRTKARKLIYNDIKNYY